MNELREFIRTLFESRIDWKAASNAIVQTLDEPMADMGDVVNEVCKDLANSGFKFLGHGRNRVTYLSPTGRSVVKVPLNVDGLDDNEAEAKYWKKRKANFLDDSGTDIDDLVALARCRLMGALLVMELVDTDVPASEFPAWAAYIDCQQVGRNRRGRIVAYDYA